METAEVESVAELTACGVCIVMRIGELAVVADETAGDAAELVGVAARGCGRFVHLAKELFDDILYCIGAAEGTDETGLCRGVAGYLHLVRNDIACTA